MSQSDPVPSVPSSPPESEPNLLSHLERILEHMTQQNKDQISIIGQVRSSNDLVRQTNKRVNIILIVAGLALALAILQTVRMYNAVNRLEVTESHLMALKTSLNESLDLSREMNARSTVTEKKISNVEALAEQSPKLVADKGTGQLKLEVPLINTKRPLRKASRAPAAVAASAVAAAPPVSSDDAASAPKAVVPLPAPQAIDF